MIMAVVIVLGVVVVIEVLAAWSERGLKWSWANLKVINLMAVAVVSGSEDGKTVLKVLEEMMIFMVVHYLVVVLMEYCYWH